MLLVFLLAFAVAVRGDAAVVAGDNCECAEPSEATREIVLSYTDFFRGSESAYCCPHRKAEVYIGGRQVVGTATLVDNKFSIGAIVRVATSEFFFSLVLFSFRAWQAEKSHFSQAFWTTAT